MPHITARDGTRLYYEEAGQGTPVVFVHEYAADYRTWEPQMRRFSRSHRCVTYSQRGYPPSDIPDEPDKYLQDKFRDDVIAVMDALKIDKAHVVGHSMGAATALHVGRSLDEHEELVPGVALLDQRLPSRQVDLVGDRGDLGELPLRGGSKERHALDQVDLGVVSEVHGAILRLCYAARQRASLARSALAPISLRSLIS